MSITIKLTAKDTTVNGHSFDLNKDNKTVTAMMKAVLFKKEQ